MPPDPGSPALTEEVGQFVRDLLEAWNTHDTERIKAFMPLSTKAWTLVRRNRNRDNEAYPGAWKDICEPSPTYVSWKKKS